ncbi:pentapeptide repeat-containing protein [Lysinibacillus sphaericus]|uniref:pentapeptide repeat-containing protein n=1 Tax=Lysinibacillus sphaericus TaxID=1421 RepID=UPI001CC04039|nr:pentapeptide repeat-containing protein [Lysinibacillus sphaericus]
MSPTTFGDEPNYDLNNSSFLEVNFKGCDFLKVYLSGASLCGSTFEDCIFKDNIFIKGNSDYAIFKKSNIAGINGLELVFMSVIFLK